MWFVAREVVVPAGEGEETLLDSDGPPSHAHGDAQETSCALDGQGLLVAAALSDGAVEQR